MGVDKIKDIIDKLNEGKISKKEIEKLLEPLNISIGGSAYALEFSYLTIKELSDGRCLYVENTVRIGEIAGEADFGTGGVEAKVGYALVTIDTDMGYIDQDGKYGVKGGLKIGQEAGVTASNDEVEVSFGPGSIGLVFDDGFNYYEWQ